MTGMLSFCCYVMLTVRYICYYCVTFAESEPYSWVIPLCLSVCLDVYCLPRLIDHNQIWSAGIYLSSDPCKPFWIPYLPYFRCQREKYATRILATANVTHRAIWLVIIIISASLSIRAERLCYWNVVHPSVCLHMCIVAKRLIGSGCRLA